MVFKDGYGFVFVIPVQSVVVPDFIPIEFLNSKNSLSVKSSK